MQLRERFTKPLGAISLIAALLVICGCSGLGRGFHEMAQPSTRSDPL
jgi:hypothetical protein